MDCTEPVLSPPTQHHHLHCHLCFYRGRNSTPPRFPQQDKMWEKCGPSLQPCCMTGSQEGQCQQMWPQGRLLPHLSWWHSGSWAAGRDPSDEATIHSYGISKSAHTTLGIQGEAGKQDWCTLWVSVVLGYITSDCTIQEQTWEVNCVGFTERAAKTDYIERGPWLHSSCI